MASRKVAVDSANVIYRHLFQIRDADGSPYRNLDGVKIGHLIGLCNEVSVLYEAGIQPIFVFDGETPALKEETMKKRAEKMTDREFKLDSYMQDEMKKTLDILGVPWVQAPEEAEAQAALMTLSEYWAALTNDYDALLFGAIRVIRSLSKGRVEICMLSDVLNGLQIDRRRLIDIGLLIGTDYNPGGIRGFGAKRSLKLVREHCTLEQILSELGQDDATRKRFEEIERYYIDPPITKNWDSSWKPPDPTKARAYLIDDKKLGEKSIRRLIKKIRSGLTGHPTTSQTTLGR